MANSNELARLGAMRTGSSVTVKGSIFGGSRVCRESDAAKMHAIAALPAGPGLVTVRRAGRVVSVFALPLGR